MLQELIKLKQIEPLDKAVSEIVGDGTLPLAFTLNAILLSTGWIQVGSVWEYTYINSAINEHSIAHVIPVNADLEVTRSAILLPANSSYNGGVKIYALNKAADDIHVVINVFGDGVEPAPPIEVPTKLSQLEKDINFDERYYTEAEILSLLDGKENVPTQAEWDNFVLTIQG